MIVNFKYRKVRQLNELIYAHLIIWFINYVIFYEKSTSMYHIEKHINSKCFAHLNNMKIEH